ncbi:hypothetical protein [Ferrimicrobium sp.]|uniref:hypothetical protein n=1 Tax=Ferrimicrobium sp. TaxID=2926050 RepID=UPI0026021F8B|nr:hypothetical protein [Ferrimicrobium sp.]
MNSILHDKSDFLASETTDAPSDTVWDDYGGEEPCAAGPALDTPFRVVAGNDVPFPRTYRPKDQANRNIGALTYFDGKGTHTITNAPKRLYAILSAYFWPIRDAAGQVWLVPRRKSRRPLGGVCAPLMDDWTINRAIARFAEFFPHANLPGKDAVITALRALGGEAHPVGELWVRWGRSSDGALWWDSGNGHEFVRVDRDGWSVHAQPECFFRSGPARAMAVPTRGGSLDDLWEFVPVRPVDRPLVVAWMLTAMHPDRETAAGILYLSGPEGSGKSTAADKITEAIGSPVARKKLDMRRGDDRDLIVGASAGWVLGLDNLSTLTAEQQDLLCTLATGHEETYRVLHTTTDTVTLSVRRPITMTSIEVPVLRPDLISRMVPVTLGGLDIVKPEDELAKAWRIAQPFIFGALLDLLVEVMGTPTLTSSHSMPRLAALGRIALIADQRRGTDTLSRLAVATSALLGDTVSDDPFFDALTATIRVAWSGTAANLLAMLDPDDELARRYGRSWPTAKGVSARLKRSWRALEGAGWRLSVDHLPNNRGQRWTLIPPLS